MSWFALGVQPDLGAACADPSSAWERFAQGEHQPAGVRPIILDSWKRCRASGLDPWSGRQPRILPSGYVDHYLKTDRTFAHIKQDLLWLESAAADLGHVIVCCDAAGRVMRVTGDAAAGRRADRINFIPGSDWSEYQAGTNAIGTAIVTRAPIQVLGSEHYLQAAHHWTCSAAPIRDPITRDIVAIINLSGPKEACWRQALPVVMMFARLVEERLRAEYESERNALLEHFADHACRAEGAMIAVVDRSGRVVKASPGLDQRGWIDRNRCITGYSDAPLTAGSEIVWEADGVIGRGIFSLTPCVNRGAVSGALIRIKDSASGASVALPSSHGGKNGQMHSFENLIGSSPSFLRAAAVARSAATAAFPVLLEGESGTGKELLAESIHMASPRRRMPFVAVNCAALSRELAASEFFGYDAGAFTGAAKDGRPGKFEQANGGTLFLDEIGDMPLELQALLLRVVEDNNVIHLGGRRSIAVDVRVIAATNQDLLKGIEQGTFRKDLYYRLSVINIKLPPLRERPQDIVPLFNAHLRRAFATVNRALPTIAPDVTKALQRHSWPGNVREVRNLSEWIAVNCRNGSVELTDLPAVFREASQHVMTGSSGHDESLESRELEAIQSTLRSCTGNITEAARQLGIHRSTIYRRLGKCGQ